MYAQLGNIIFEGLKGWTDINDSRASNIVEHALIEGKPRLQRVGSGLTSLNFNLTLHADFCNPEAELEALETAREAATVLPLILGNGVYAGEFVITDLNRTTDLTDKRGNIIKSNVAVQLKESYSPDRLKKRQLAARQKAFATTSGGAAPLRLITPARPSPGLAAMAQVKLAQLEVANTTGYIDRAALAASEADSLVSRTGQSLQRIQAAMADLQNRIADPLLNVYAGNMPAAIRAVDTAAINFQAALPWPDIATALTLNNALSGTITNLTAASTGIVQAIATRRI